MSANVKISGNTYNGVSKVVLKDTNNADVTFSINEETALYALADAVRSSIVIFRKSNGNRIRLEFTEGSSSSFVVNLRNIVAAVNNMNILNESKWFTIPAGQCEFKITNVVNVSSLSYALNFKLAESTTSTQEFGTGQHADSNPIDLTINNPNAQDVGCLFISITAPTAGSVLEFDVELTANGVRYI